MKLSLEPIIAFAATIAPPCRSFAIPAGAYGVLASGEGTLDTALRLATLHADASETDAAALLADSMTSPTRRPGAVAA